MTTPRRAGDFTDVQKAFFESLTDQRVANILEAADDWADLSPEAKEWLRKADKTQIEELNSTLSFMKASRIIWKFIWVGGGMMVGGFVTIMGLIKTFGDFFVIKIK